MKASFVSRQQWPDLTTRTVLLAHGVFPGSLFDAQQFLNLLEADRLRKNTEKEDYTRSEVVKCISNRVSKLTGQGAMAGIVGLSYIVLNEMGKEPSLEKAAKIASEVGYNSQFVSRRQPNKKQKQDKGWKLNADNTGVKKAFRKFRSTAHIWMAELAMDTPEDETLMRDFPKSTYAQGVHYFQTQLEFAADTSTWGLLNLHPLFIGASYERPTMDTLWDNAPLAQIMAAYDDLENRGVV